MRKINLKTIMLVCFGLYIVNSLYHPLVNISFNKDEINANLIYHKWITKNNQAYQQLKFGYRQKKSKAEKENKVNENKVNFVRPSQRRKEIEISIKDEDSFDILMWMFWENKEYDKAILYINKYDASYKKLMENKDMTKKISNFFVMTGLLLAIFLWFRRKG